MLDLHPAVRAILEKRGIPTEQWEAFIYPDFQRDLHDPYLLKGMEKAVVRLERAIAAGEKITVFGDYDADGVPATALLVRAFRRLGVEVDPRIPTRAAGYGLNQAAVEAIAESGASVLITVDNGTVSQQEIAWLAEKGIDTIVCDHHQPQDGHSATAALAILNPKQSDCAYPFKELCGCALGWKLMVALYQRLGKDTSSLKWELDLVGFSTVADMVPLLGENRALVHFGLKVLGKTRNLGLRALAAAAEVDLSMASAGAIGFRLAPRINAPSRMHQEMEAAGHVALRLLTTEDAAEAERLAAYLNGQNADRQRLVEEHVKSAEAMAGQWADQLCLAVYDESWSTGIIGLVAGKLVEKYRRPAIAMASEDGVVKGSVRTVEGVDAVALLQAAESLLERYGGHGRAAGFSLRNAQVAEFRSTVEEWMRQGGWQLEGLEKSSRRLPDSMLPLEEATVELAEELRLLEPYGIGFPTPLFQAECRIRWPRRVGASGAHLACVVEDDKGERRKAIAFGQGDFPLEEGRTYAVSFVVTTEKWNGQESAVCQIQGLEPSDA